MENEKFTFFWHGAFSQWHPCNFKIDNVEYCNTEQYMMAQKAILFGDNDTLSKIMATKDPREQKALGRKVKNFDPVKWNEEAKDVVYDGNFAKYIQNPDVLHQLFLTEGTTLVEASPYDKIWGIGLLANDPKAQSRDTWNGTNWLGEEITDVRDIIMKMPYGKVWKVQNGIIKCSSQPRE